VVSSSFRCDQIFNCQAPRFDFGHTVLLLKADLDDSQTLPCVRLVFSLTANDLAYFTPTK
jgi:hypothetical protein